MIKKRVMIVEDSAVIRELLQFIIGRDARLEVVASVESAEEALRVLNRTAPDVISMDIQLPGMNGLDATRRIMTVRPTPIVVIAGSVSTESTLGIQALKAGALAVVEKPVGVTHSDYDVLSERICTQLAIMSQVKVVRRRFDAPPSGTFERPPVLPSAALRQNVAVNNGRFSMLGIVASTGGPNAVVQVLAGLGADFPLPILLIQHITSCFLDGFVSWLRGTCPFQVVIAQQNETPVAGKVYLPSADRHLCVEGNALRMNSGETVSFQRPSGTVLFESMARSLGPRALGVVVDGDGRRWRARSFLAVRQAGGFTIAEDVATTAVVYGMPAEAVRLNAVCESPCRCRALRGWSRSAWRLSRTDLPVRPI